MSWTPTGKKPSGLSTAKHEPHIRMIDEAAARKDGRFFMVRRAWRAAPGTALSTGERKRTGR